MAWLILLVAAAFEIAFALSLKPSEGFSKLWPTLGVLVFGVISVALLARTLDRLPVGTAYAIWTGLGSVGVVTLGIILFDEPITPARIACIALIVTGVVGLRLAGAD
ncbi:DMT family transporter [Kribbella solani]|uniref:Quaternary ammonium compound-resistance protein SugE n=1 Tax=Kribbella solani TaxID=236067 RepID=A0A841DZ67_9ACTN|nr:multidrug efflux SMR transporter [Kribbella solani]MBB5983459.1 quaternary ammonium compound-resistance protein SugE [Kribbella solani]MDX2971898.1 multidrug efflux SMR transporter [Kribbella solani]MDX3006957.1 multidrug efflux SMR transporter [Kribbella solani]